MTILQNKLTVRVLAGFFFLLKANCPAPLKQPTYIVYKRAIANAKGLKTHWGVSEGGMRMEIRVLFLISFLKLHVR